jgi:hypothetical protein
MLQVYSPELFAPQDDLLERRMTLSNMNDIPDMQAYAAAWLKLAEDFDLCGLVNNASYCRSRGNHYKSLTMVKAVRIIDTPFAELVEVE